MNVNVTTPTLESVPERYLYFLPILFLHFTSAPMIYKYIAITLISNKVK